MGAMKVYYENIASKYSDDELRKRGWSKEWINWLRECFGGPDITK